jgi:hypothetical protein
MRQEKRENVLVIDARVVFIYIQCTYCRDNGGGGNIISAVAQDVLYRRKLLVRVRKACKRESERWKKKEKREGEAARREGRVHDVSSW